VDVLVVVVVSQMSVVSLTSMFVAGLSLIGNASLATKWCFESHW